MYGYQDDNHIHNEAKRVNPKLCKNNK